ncbi:response regulator transcription factor, partial [Variovorax sp. CT11-76]
VLVQGLGLHEAPVPAPAALTLLSRREAEVARLFAQGQSYKMVARTLGSSPATVRHHLRQVYAKLGVTSKVQMARLVGAQAA